MRGLEPRLSKTGAIIGDRDRKHTPFPYGKPVILDNFSLFQTKLRHRLRHTCVYAARIFADVKDSCWGNGVRNSRNLLCFWTTIQRVSLGERYPPRPLASVDNTLLNLQNSSHHTKAEFNNS